MNKNGNHGGGGAVTAFIAGAVAATAVTGYFLYGPKGKGNRKQVEEWVKKAQKEITERYEAAKDMTVEAYEAVVDEVMARYARLKEVGEERAETAAADLKKRFREIAKEATRLKKELDEETRT